MCPLGKTLINNHRAYTTYASNTKLHWFVCSFALFPLFSFCPLPMVCIGFALFRIGCGHCTQCTHKFIYLSESAIGSHTYVFIHCFCVFYVLPVWSYSFVTFVAYFIFFLSGVISSSHSSDLLHLFCQPHTLLFGPSLSIAPFPLWSCFFFCFSASKFFTRCSPSFCSFADL